MTYENSGLIEADALIPLLSNNTGIKLLDASYGSGAKAVHEGKRIDKAVFFDIDDIADTGAPLPHTIPDESVFAAKVSALGISNDDLVVVYDQSGIAMAACRVWWMFRLFGHDRVCVLNGGLPYWEACGHPLVTTAPEKPVSASFTAKFRPELVYYINDMKAATQDNAITILDARSRERFAGQTQEADPDLRRGHIPNSLNMPFMDLIGDDGRMKEKAEIERALHALPPASDVVTTCGSGVTACVVSLALYQLGIEKVPVYDGSWTEWGHKNAGTEVATGA